MLYVKWWPFCLSLIVLRSVGGILHFELTRNTPYLTLMGELRSVSWEYFAEKWHVITKYHYMFEQKNLCFPSTHEWV